MSPSLSFLPRLTADAGPVGAPLVVARPQLMLFGDPHGHFGFVIDAVERHRPAAIVLLGDIQAQRPLHLELAAIAAHTDIWFIHGNHDTDSDADFDHLFGSQLAHRNLHGRVVDIAGVRVAGLGGVFRASIWAPPLEPVFASAAERLKVVRPTERWRGGLPRRHRSTIFPDVVQNLSRQRADVLVTHEALGGHPYGWPALDEVALALRAQLVAHGHLHKTIDYRAEGRLAADCPYQAYGVAPEHFLAWPRSAAVVEGGLA